MNIKKNLWKYIFVFAVCFLVGTISTQAHSSVPIQHAISLDETIKQFENTFIKNDRYMFIVKGLIVTLRISFCAVLLGICFGSIIAAMKLTANNKKNKQTVLSRIANVYIDVLRGTPVTVQLLIMYLVVLKGNPELSAILAFGMNSGAYVAEILRAGILGVDHGQTEAGRSLGLSNMQTMAFIIVPQAIKTVVPVLGNEFIVLIKETAIVGLIAVQDLTKAGDLLISRTYHAFMPLIGVALIYFMLVKLLTILFQIIERRLRKSDTR